MAEEIVLVGQLLAEELTDLGDEGSGRAEKTGFHSTEYTALEDGRNR